MASDVSTRTRDTPSARPRPPQLPLRMRSAIAERSDSMPRAAAVAAAASRVTGVEQRHRHRHAEEHPAGARRRHRRAQPAEQVSVRAAHAVCDGRVATSLIRCGSERAQLGARRSRRATKIASSDTARPLRGPARDSWHRRVMKQKDHQSRTRLDHGNASVPAATRRPLRAPLGPDTIDPRTFASRSRMRRTSISRSTEPRRVDSRRPSPAPQQSRDRAVRHPPGDPPPSVAFRLGGSDGHNARARRAPRETRTAAGIVRPGRLGQARALAAVGHGGLARGGQAACS